MGDREDGSGVVRRAVGPVPYRGAARTERAADGGRTSGVLIRDAVGTAAYDSPPAVRGCSWEPNP
jgi:hypothetical protein